ncbi:MAG: stage II sporulation protein P [Ruminococcus sp.]|jgi:stage II sporulation protein P|nr:stage II sporulation protein P [Ruminococcus sp.]
MRKKKIKPVLGQALIYLTLLIITPFICMTFVRAANPADIEEVVVTVETVPVQIKAEFKIITDDSFFESSDGLHIPPASDDEEVDTIPAIPAIPDSPAPAGIGKIEVITYGQMEGSSYINLDYGQIRNMTAFDNNEIKETALQSPGVKFLRDGSPEILIYHTHATEGYLPDGSESFDPDFAFRSVDKSINMVAVGKAITDELTKAGFGVIHDETLFDEESYTGAYEASRAAVKEHLAANPGIKLVLDVHRDAIVRSETEIAAPTVVIDGKNAAQIMIVSNCDGESLKYPIPLFRENLKIAAAINETACEGYEGLMRPLLFDYRQYNQDLSPGALLIEVGGHGNTLSEALYSGELFGKAIAVALQQH